MQILPQTIGVVSYGLWIYCLFQYASYCGGWQCCGAILKPVVRSVAVFHHNIGTGIIPVGAPATGKIIHKNVVPDDDIGSAVNIDVFVASLLVVEQVAFDNDITDAMVYL